MMGQAAAPPELLEWRLWRAWGRVPPALSREPVRWLDAMRYLAVSDAVHQVAEEQGWQLW